MKAAPAKVSRIGSSGSCGHASGWVQRVSVNSLSTAVAISILALSGGKDDGEQPARQRRTLFSVAIAALDSAALRSQQHHEFLPPRTCGTWEFGFGHPWYEA